jgi:hypothetical protein
MRKIIYCVLAMLFVTISVQAQENENKEYDVYALLVGTQKMIGNKVTITIDYGQATTFFENTARTMQVIDKDGNATKFNSIIDACNYMSSKGWVYVNAYSASSKQGICYHYLFKKRGSATFDVQADLGVRGKKTKQKKESMVIDDMYIEFE